MTPRTNRTSSSLAVALVAGALIGAGGGAATYAALSPSKGTTVVRQVTVADAQPASTTTSGLSVPSIYRLARKGVVEVSSPQGQGSGFVYDTRHVLTNQHVGPARAQVTVKRNGKSYSAPWSGRRQPTWPC